MASIGKCIDQASDGAHHRGPRQIRRLGRRRGRWRSERRPWRRRKMRMRGMRMRGMRMRVMPMRVMRMRGMRMKKQDSTRVTCDVLVQLTAVAGHMLHRVQPGSVAGLGAGEHAVQCKESEGNMQPMLPPMPSAKSRHGDSMVPCHERSHQHASTKHKLPWIEYAAVVQNMCRRHGKAGRRHGKASRRHRKASRRHRKASGGKASKHHQHVVKRHQIAIRCH